MNLKDATLTPILGNDRLDVCEIRDKDGNLIGHTTVHKNLPPMEVRGTIMTEPFEHATKSAEWVQETCAIWRPK